jgi:hypothetical protein
MKQHDVIERKTRVPAEGSFEALRNEAIGFVQALSGNVWTDYNLHDPGVTILEQLSFALTELGYRADFPVEDHLTDENRRIDWEKQSLHRPEEILPCRPTTTADYRVLLLDKLLDDIDLAYAIDDVLVSTNPHSFDVEATDSNEQNVSRGPDDNGGRNEQIGGLYYFGLRLQQDNEGAKEKVRGIYRAHRNLGEDLESVDPIVGETCVLDAEIHIEGARDPIDVLAEIYDYCEQHVAGKPHLETFEEIDASEKSLDEILEGPDAQLRISTVEKSGKEAKLVRSQGALRASVAAISCVKHVISLETRDLHGNPLTEGKAFRLQQPDSRGKLKVKLKKRGVEVEIAARDLEPRLDDRRRQHRQRTRVVGRALRSRPMPTGQYRHVQRYHSLQKDLPAIYGVNEHGIPESATLKEMGRAKQLKAYLVLLEQVIANGAFNLDHVRELFSADTASRQSYWFRLLDEESVPGISELFEGKRTTFVQEREQEHTRRARPPEKEDVFQGFDDYPSRKGRVLDHLLALYGERFAQNSLRGFADYWDPDELEDALVENKAAFLKAIVEWTRDRASGFDYSKPSWNKRPSRDGDPHIAHLFPAQVQLARKEEESKRLAEERKTATPDRREELSRKIKPLDEEVEDLKRQSNCSGLQLRIGRLLGFKHNFSRSLTSAILKLPREVGTAEPESSEQKYADGEKDLERVSMTTRRYPVTEHARRAMHDDLVRVRPVMTSRLSQTLLRIGTKKDRYWSERVRAGEQRLLLLELDDDDQTDDKRQFWKLGYFSDQQSVERAACHLRTFLIRLNKDSEGSHVIEHVLLRPTAGQSETTDSWFYSHRLTVVFPNWTARFQREAFQRLAEETVQLNCPAHLRAKCVWMDFGKMQTFEKCYEAWLDAKIEFCKNPSGDEARKLDDIARGVIDCIKNDYWPNAKA